MIYAFIMTVLVAIDQITKYWARTYLAEAGSIGVIDGFLHLTYVENRGAAFGMFQGGSYIFAVTSVVIVVGLFVYLKKTNAAKVQYYIASVITAGAIGNLIDRLSFGFVTDMIDFRGIWQWVFNVADIYVVLGGICFLCAIMAEERAMQVALDAEKSSKE